MLKSLPWLDEPDLNIKLSNEKNKDDLCNGLRPCCICSLRSGRQTAKKRVELDKKQILHLQASVWNTQLLMKHGNANYLEVLTAQKNLLQAELSEVTDRFNEIQAVVNLYQALGGGY